MVRSGRKGYKRVRSLARSGHLGQFTAWSCQIWQLEVHTLSQRLRCFPTESRAVIFPQRWQYSPLTPPINRISVEDLGGEKFGSKVSQKTSIFTQFLQIFLLLLSSSATGNRHRLPPTPPLQPLAEPPHHSSHNPFGQANSQRKKKQGGTEKKTRKGEKKEKDPKERERRDDRDRRQKKKINRGRTNKKKEKQGQHEGIKVWKNTQEPDQARRTRRENVHLAEKNKKKTHHH